MRALTFPDVLGLLIVLAFMAVVACVVAYSRMPRALKLLVYAALTLRAVGSWLRYAVLFGFYDGSGDATGYYRRGLDFAERFVQLDFSPFVDPNLWLRGQWWGTSFLSFPSGIILTGIGPSLLGEFVAFSLLAFLGLVCFAIAFRRAHPDVPVTRYALWIWLFPSLWFWPSSVGKEAILLLGLGLAVAGFIGRNGRVNWPLLIGGTFLLFAVRAELAAVVILSCILAQWLSLEARWTLGKTLQGLLILVVGLGVIWLALDQIGVQRFDVEGVQGYMEDVAGAASGGSDIGGAEVGLSGIPLALVNILSRPFLWEAHNVMALFSALEIFAVWVIIWIRRRNVVSALRNWRAHRLLRLALPFILVYSITLGMVITNLGIIARQRIFIFPFLFLMLEAVPAHRTTRSAPSRPSGPIKSSIDHRDIVGHGVA